LSSFSFYQVLENPAVDNAGAAVGFQRVVTTQDTMVMYPFTSNVSRIFWRNIGTTNGTTTPIVSAQNLYSFNYSKIGVNNNYNLSRNGTLALQLIPTTGTSGGFDNLYIGSSGGGQYLNTNMQELIFYPIDQSSNRTGIETNINDFYSIY
jgi:hypothetical protein